MIVLVSSGKGMFFSELLWVTVVESLVIKERKVHIQELSRHNNPGAG